jgi:hypothetical protein
MHGRTSGSYAVACFFISGSEPSVLQTASRYNVSLTKYVIHIVYFTCYTALTN